MSLTDKINHLKSKYRYIIEKDGLKEILISKGKKLFITTISGISLFYMLNFGYNSTKAENKNNKYENVRISEGKLEKLTQAQVDSFGIYVKEKIIEADKAKNEFINAGYSFYVDSTAIEGGDGSESRPFQTINEGISAASATASKAIVYVGPGTYPENISLLDSIAICGKLRENTRIIGKINADHTKGWLLANFTIKSPIKNEYYGIDCSYSKGTLQNLNLEEFLVNSMNRNDSQTILRDCFGKADSEGGDVLAIGSSTEVILYSNTFIGDSSGTTTSSGIVSQMGANLIVMNTISTDHVYGFVASNGGNLTSLYNLTFGMSSGSHFGLSPDITDMVEVDPLFVGGPYGKIKSYKLKPESPARDGGNPLLKDNDLTRSNIGWFANDTTYINGIEIKASVGDIITIPIILRTDQTIEGKDIRGIDVTQRYNPLVLKPIEVINENTLTQNWMMEYNVNETPYIYISAASIKQLIGTGTLVNVKYEVVGPGTSDITTEDMVLNETPLLKEIGLNETSLSKIAQEQLPIVDKGITIDSKLFILYGDADSDTSITALDASQILRYVVNKITLTLEQQIKADVSGEMGVTAYDAGLILRYVVGLIDKFPVELQKKELNKNIELLVNKEEKNGFVDYHINVENIDVFAMQMVFNYDKSSLEFENIFSEVKNLQMNDKEGKLYIALASAEPINNEVTLRYRKTGENTELNLEQAMVNEYKAIVKQSIPKEYVLSQNYPNPFNPITNIKYKLPKENNVELKIYNILGQEVRTLVNEKQIAGNYSIQWDGKMENGMYAASGIYLYQLKTPDFISTKKMIFIK